MAINNVYGPTRYLWIQGEKKLFRNKKELDRRCEKEGWIIKPDFDDDSTGRTFRIINEVIPVAELSIPGVERGFKTTEQEFEEWFTEWCVGAKAEGCWTEPENLHDAMRDAFMAGKE